MENLNKTSKYSNEKKYQITIVILVVIIILLLWQLIAAKMKVKTVVVEKTKIIEKNYSLQSELDSLLYTHEQIKKEYGDLTEKLTEKDSIIQANAKEIQRLISQQADYWQIKRKLKILRNITQGYVKQIDSLFTVNAALKEENLAIKKDYSQEKQKNIELSKEKEELSKQITSAAKLKAYNIKTTGLRLRGKNEREEITNKANRIEILKICFTLSENQFVEPGPKTVYVRIARPDNLVLVKGNDDIYSFIYNGERIQYSLKKEIDYQNKSMDICLTWEKHDKKEPAMTGTYHISVFVDDYEIGQTSFTIE